MYQNLNHIGAAIGANYENALSAIDTPSSETYLPYPAAEMTCDQLRAGISAANNFIGLWAGRLASALNTFIPSKQTIANINAILNNLKGKLQQYNTALTLCLQMEQQQAAADAIPQTAEPEEAKSSGLLWLVAAGVGVFFLTRRNRKKSSPRKKSKR